MLVQVRNDNINKAISLLNKKLKEDGLFRELREREFFQSKGQLRRKAQRSASVRHKKRES